DSSAKRIARRARTARRAGKGKESRAAAIARRLLGCSRKAGAAVISSFAEQVTNLQRLAPELVLCFFGILIMVVDPFVGAARKKSMGWLGLVGSVVALVSIRCAGVNPGAAYSDLMRVDRFSVFVHYIVVGAAILAILGSLNYLEEGIQRGEFYALILFATAGMGIMAGANELITAFVGLEMSSIVTYVLVGFRRRAL